MKTSERRASWIVPALLGLLAGGLFVRLPLPWVLILLAGSALLVPIVRRPEAGILLIILAVSSIVFEEALPLIPIGFGSLHVPDVLLLLLLAMVLFRVKTDGARRRVRTPMDVPLLLFFGASLVSVLVAHSAGTGVADIRRAERNVAYYLLFFAVTQLVRSREQLVLLVRGMFAIAALVAAAMVAQAAVGPSVSLMPGRLEAASTFGHAREALRILPPGQAMVYALFITAICTLTLMKSARPLIMSGFPYLAALLGVGVLLTYNRSYWIAVIAASGILLWIVPIRQKNRLLFLAGTGFLGFVLAALLAVSVGGRPQEAVSAVSERFGSLLAGENLMESSSLQMRYVENRLALRRIAEHPLLGVGTGSKYRSNLLYWDGEGGDPLQHYIHNGYLWVMTKMGIVGLLPYLWFWMAFLHRGLRNWKRVQDPLLQSVTVGFTLSGIGFLLIAAVIPVFVQWFSVVVIAVVSGTVGAITSLRETSASQPET